LLNYAGIIEKENIRLKHQVERVLQMARLDKEDIGLKKERVDIHQLIQDAIRTHTMALQEKAGSLKCELNATATELNVDKLHLTNVFNNLLDNAIKYCKTIPEITIKSFNHHKGFMVEVADNGIGISSENQKRVFQKFYRVPTGNVHDVKGFGLGLSYAKTIVHAHGGEITLLSELGRGCSFRIYFPIQ